MLEYPLLLLLPVALVIAGACDLLTGKIPNKISLALIAGFFGAAVLAGMSWTAILTHVGVAVAVCAIGFVLFTRGWMGGGDVKLLSSVALWFGYEHLLLLIALVTLINGVLTLLIVAYRRLVPEMLVAGYAWAERWHDRKRGAPYGLALAAAGLWIFPSSRLFLAYAA